MVTTFGARLRHLMETTRHPSGRPWSYRNLARSIGKSHNLILHLVSDQRLPDLSVTKSLADAFGVPVSYFTDDPPTPRRGGGLSAAEQRLQEALNDPQIRSVVIKLARAQLSPAGIEAVVDAIRTVQRLEAAAQAAAVARVSAGQEPRAAAGRRTRPSPGRPGVASTRDRSGS